MKIKVSGFCRRSLATALLLAMLPGGGGSAWAADLQGNLTVSGEVGVGTGTPAASAQLEVTSTTKGLLPPRMTAAQRGAIASPIAGLLVYQTEAPTGLYSYNGSAWVLVGAMILPSQTGNTGKFLTTDGSALSWGTAGGGGSITEVSGTSPITVTNGTTTPAISLGTVGVANGGTGATTAADARTALSAAASGANGDITSLTGLSTALTVGQGGTGATTAATAAAALLPSQGGNDGKVLTTNGSVLSWATAGGGGSVTEVSGTSPITVTNGTSTPAISLGTVPVASGGTGSITGSITGTGALALAAGGSNGNVTLTPSGTGSTMLGGNVAIGGTTSPSSKLRIADTSTTGESKSIYVTKSGVTSGNAYGGWFDVSGSGGWTEGIKAVAYGTGAIHAGLYAAALGASTSTNYGVSAEASEGSAQNIGIYGKAFGSTGTQSYAGFFENTATTANARYGVYGKATGNSTGANYGGYFTAANTTVGGTAYALVTGTGNVGIGTATPAYALDVTTDTSHFGLTHSDGTIRVGSYVGEGYGELGTITAHPLAFFTGSSAPQMWLMTDGRVGIGTQPGYALHVNGSVAGIGGYNALSDARLKKDVQPIGDALAIVEALRGVTFNWDQTVDPAMKLDERNHIGFIAQEIEAVLPQAVTTAADARQTKSVAYSEVVPVLTEAIKQQQRQIETLKTENAALKTQQAAILQRLAALERK